MKNIKKIPIILFLFIIISNTETSFAQVPQGINYQTVIRSSNGDPVVANASTTPQNIHCEISIFMGNQPGQAGAQVVYGEKHLGLTTNNMGIVNFVIGGGSPTSSLLFENIDWSNGPYYFQLKVDRDGTGNLFGYQDYGYQQLVSVPFALYSELADSIAGVDLNNIGSAGLSAYEIAVQNGFIGTEAEWLASLQGADGQDGTDGSPGLPGADGQDGADGSDGADGATGPQGPQGDQGPIGLTGPAGADGSDGADGQGGVTQAGTNVIITGDGTPSNPYIIDAIQTISTDGSPGNISLNDGGGIININVFDGDDSATNEIQDISTDGSSGNISISDGSIISINVDDQDPDPSNEIQVISFSNDTLYLSNGGQVFLGVYATDLVNDADSDPTNEIELPTNANVGDILEFDGSSWVSASPSIGGAGAGAVMYIYNGQICPSGWSTQQINVAIFGGVAVDACYTNNPCVVMYIYDGQSCPTGWTHQSIGAAVINNTTTPVDACYKCN